MSKAKSQLLQPRGYTLIEILVTITIIATIFGFGYAGFRDFSRRQNLSGAAGSVMSDLRLAQQLALSGKRPSGCTSSDILSGYAFKVVNNKNYELQAVCGAAPKYIPTKSVEMQGDISLSTPATNPIIFKVLGQGTNLDTSASFELTQAGTNKTETITVTAAGGITGVTN